MTGTRNYSVKGEQIFIAYAEIEKTHAFGEKQF